MTEEIGKEVVVVDSAIVQLGDIPKTAQEIFDFVRTALVEKATPLKETSLVIHDQALAVITKNWEDWTLEDCEQASRLYDQIAAHEKVVRGKGTELDTFRDKAEKLKKGILRALDDIMADLPVDHERLKESIRAWRRREEDRAKEEARKRDEENRRREEELRISEAIALEAEGEKDAAAAIMEEPLYVPPTPVAAAIPQGGPRRQELWTYNETELNNPLSPAFKALPDKYKMPNHKMIRATVNTQKNLTDIPGVKVRPR